MSTSEIYVSGAMPHSRHVLSSRVRILGVKYQKENSANIKPDNYEVVGAISNFQVQNNRPLEPVRGIGLGDHIMEMVPGQSEPMSLNITRAALSLSNIFQEFGYAGGVDGIVRALKHHRYPVDIKQEILVSKIASGTKFDSVQGPHVENSPSPATAGGPKAGVDAFKAWQNEEDLTDETNGGFRAIVTWYLGCWFEDYSVTYGVDTTVVSEEATIKVSDVSGVDNQAIYVPYPLSNYRSAIWFPDYNTAG